MRQRIASATSALIVALLLAWAPHAWAIVVGQVTHLSGPLFAVGDDGQRRILSIGSSVETGETLITESKTYAQVRFIDKGAVTLKPGTHFRVETYAFEESAPGQDNAVLNLVKGGFRTLTGLIGKRGNQNAYRLNTATATIGIRGTIYDAHFCIGDSCGAVQPGLYLAVIDGSIVVTNNDGVQTTLPVTAGQYVYVASATAPPVILPGKPDIPVFDPPASMPALSDAPGNDPGTTANREGCEVR